VLLALLALIISIGITHGEFHYGGDEMRHAFTGVFFRDLFVDRPWHNLPQYVYEYYAKYPSLGLIYWPPFFHVVEGVFFLVFGISVLTSRLTILAFALMGIYYWYRIAEREGTRDRALFSALIFPILPFILTFERVTMLEIPMMAMCLAAIFFWQSFLREERRRDLIWLGLYLVGALFTSQKAIFLAFFIGMHFLVERKWRLLKRWDTWVIGAACVAAVYSWYAFSAGHQALFFERVAGHSFAHVARVSHLFFYPQRITFQLGIILGVLGITGMLWALVRAPREHRFFLVWILACYVCYTLILEKTTRHTMIWVPPFVYFALLIVEKLVQRPKWVLAIWALLAIYTFSKPLRWGEAKLWGIEPVARYVTSLPESDVLYYQGYLNGDFIFFVRKYDPERRRVVAREKQVVATKVLQGYGSRTILDSPEEFYRFVETWGIRYVLIENHDPLEGLAPVHAAIRSDRFELIQAFRISSNAEYYKDLRVLVYRYRGELHRSDRPVVVPMMTLREDIKVDLMRLAGHPWPQ
jgi:hypothetical protein